MKELLKTIADEMKSLGINYDLMTWKETPIKYPYCVGQYFITDNSVESGKTEIEFWLEAWDRNTSYINLVDIDNKVKKHFGDYRKIINDIGITISYSNSSLEREEDSELKKLQIKLAVVLWEGE